MGQVWLATDERLERSVAVKIVLPDATDAQLGLRLEREARAAAAIQHTNVVRVFDYLDDAGRTLIVMEHVEGETLADRLERDGALSIEDSLDLAAQICDGLSAAHRTGLVHRDLKPSNVMVTEDRLAKVLDFGIAKRTGRAEKNLTMTGVVIGTPRYMAPEQLRGEELDARVDIHAVGLLLYEMIAGRPAFDRENFAELMYQLVNTGADMGPLEARGVAPEVIAILSRALAKQRDDRWPDAKSMSDALRVCLFGDVIHARKSTTAEGLRSIIDSGERLLARSTDGTPVIRTLPAMPAVVDLPATLGSAAVAAGVAASAGVPIAAAVPMASAVVAEAPVASAPAAHSPPTAAHRKESSRWPLVAVPALVLAVVATAVLIRKNGSSERAPTADAAPVAATAVPPAAAPASPGAVGKPTPPPATSLAPDATTPAPPAGSVEVNTTDDAARAAEAKGTESVRRAFASAVSATWQFYLKPVTNEYGDDISDMKAEFDLVVTEAGQIESVRPGRQSEEALFDESAATALQNAAPIPVGSARRKGGWPMRVRFAGKVARVVAR